MLKGLIKRARKSWDASVKEEAEDQPLNLKEEALNEKIADLEDQRDKLEKKRSKRNPSLWTKIKRIW